MHALYSTILPPSAIHHSLFLSNFTPSTIYPLPRTHVALEGPEVKVIGNLIVAGGQDLRVFEIREEAVPVRDDGDDGAAEDPMAMAMTQDGGGDMGDSFFDSAPADVSPSSSRPRPHASCVHILILRYLHLHREHLFVTRLHCDCNSSRNINCTGPRRVWPDCERLTVPSMVWTGCWCRSSTPRWG